ncbi:Calx-beta domain-containing protein [Pseudobdellovibrio exovorus]|uniref:Calx-beta domain-containing protein n=1 Tax=Pseudobdellovibrio exovorus JSS TaxID=1184267 RepID=M4VRV1_9BACT|nr:Calx-beta domain-containing protein [Pseudobdellovibrio exovorus]AGH95914.1 hypothetical protein A11Q_1698 [Pseudobdellovibrio exovorus JSS]
MSLNLSLKFVVRLLMAFTAIAVVSSCSKVNYDGRPAGILGQGQQSPQNKLDGANAFVMTEGEKNKQFTLQLTNAFNADTNYSWTIVSKDQSINPNDRFETPHGTAVGTRGQKSLTVQISAVDIDSIQQGTQEFVIALTPVNNQREILNADLTLLDASVGNTPDNLPIVSFVEYNLESDIRGEVRLALQLSRSSTSPVVVDVKLRDGSAIRHRDYTGYKTLSPNNAVEQTLIFPPGTTRMDLPVVGIHSQALCHTEFYAKMNRITVQGATIVKDKATIVIPCRPAPVPPTPTPEPTPEPIPEPPAPVVVALVDGQRFIMSEGDTRNLTLHFVENFKQDMNFGWTIIPKEQGIVVGERFKTLSGRMFATANTNYASIIVSAVDIDNLRQGDQEFEIVLTPEERDAGTTLGNLKADLTLLDKVKQPSASYERDRISAAQGTIATAKVVLTESSTLPVVIEIETQDGSARADVDYAPVKQRVVVAPGLTSVEVPVRILPQTACKDASEFYLVVTQIENAEMASKRATISIAKDEALCKPPTPPPPAPRPASDRVRF